jgi:mannose-6-phosphate isomerase-like protein (cupin superfamily)
MWLPVGNRQSGVHIHSITEIYVILRGRVESIEPGGRRQIAGPFDCLSMPPGAPHAVRAIGPEDVLLLWVHDELEEAGGSEYFEESELGHSEGMPEVQFVPWDSMSPHWDLPQAKVGGHLRWTASWVGGGEGFEHYNRDVGAVNGRVSLSALVIPPGNSEVPHAYATPRQYLVVSGRALVLGENHGPPLEPLDLVVLPPNIPHAVRAVGTDTLRLISFHEEVQPEGSARYVEAIGRA